jgi:hypothetical protein
MTWITVTIEHQVTVTYKMPETAALDPRRIAYVKEKLNNYAMQVANDVIEIGWEVNK